MKTFYIDNKKVNNTNTFDYLVSKNVSIPSPRKNELLIKTLSSGLCATDISKILKPNINKFNKNKKIYLGHETIGQVIKAGEKKFNYMVGKKVAIGDVSGCRSFSIKNECEYCKRKQGIFCIKKEKRKYNPNSYAGFSEYFLRSPHQCVILKKNINIKNSIFIEPLSTCINLMRNCKKNDIILINGFGTISILFYKLLLLKKFKKNKIFFSNDINKKKIRYLKKIKAQTIDLDKKNIKNKFNICFDFNMNFDEKKNLINCLLPESKIILFGLNNKIQKINLTNFILKGIKIIGIHGYSSSKKNGKIITDLQAAAEIVYKKKIRVDDLIQNEYPLSKVKEKILEILIKIKKKRNNDVYFRTIFTQNIN